MRTKTAVTRARVNMEEFASPKDPHTNVTAPCTGLASTVKPQARLHTLWPTRARPRRMAAVQTERRLPQDPTKRDVPNTLQVLQDKYKQPEAAVTLRDSVFHSIKSVFEKTMKNSL